MVFPYKGYTIKIYPDTPDADGTETYGYEIVDSAGECVDTGMGLGISPMSLCVKLAKRAIDLEMI